MNVITDAKLLQTYLAQYEIDSFFDTPNLHFQLLQYEKGEQMISPLNKTNRLLFMVEGSAKIYGLRPDDSYYPVAVHTAFSMYGDVEFATGYHSGLFVEAQSRVRCIALSLLRYGELLHKDVRFLNTMLQYISQKFTYISMIETSGADLEEQVLYFMKHFCKNGEIQSVNETVMHLRCSRRQLQRVLSRLCEQKQIEKIKKGTYRIRQVP